MKTARERCLEAVETAQQNYRKHKRLPQTIGQVNGPQLASIETLQARVLSMAQLEALGQVQEVIEGIARMQSGINQLCTLHSLQLRRLGLYELSLMHKEIEDLLTISQITSARLQAGSLPLVAQPDASTQQQQRVA